MKRLVVTADDFGLALPVNEAIEKAHAAGILGSASLMVAAPAAPDAVDRARRLPSLRVGLHVVLTHGTPALPADRIPDLVGPDGAFSQRLARSGFRYFLLPGVRAQLAAEIRAQFEAFRETGLSLDHVDAHHHMHVHPTVLGIILSVGRDFGMPAVRLPREPVLASFGAARRALGARLSGRVLLSPWLAAMRRRLDRAGLSRNDWIFGMTDTGRMDESLVLALLDRLPDGVSEMYFHPAARRWEGSGSAPAAYDVTGELEALTSPRVLGRMRELGIEPTGLRD